MVKDPLLINWNKPKMMFESVAKVMIANNQHSVVNSL